MITVECRHGRKPDGPTDVPVRTDRLVAQFRSRHTVTPDLQPDPPEPGRWELFREGADGTATRSKRGTWRLRCPRCGRNLPVPERELFRMFDAAHWASTLPARSGPVVHSRPGWDTTLDLAALLRARA